MSSLVDNKCKHDLRQKIIGMPDAKQFLDQTFVCNIFYSKHILGPNICVKHILLKTHFWPNIGIGSKIMTKDFIKHIIMTILR